jgi:hypothetical protein
VSGRLLHDDQSGRTDGYVTYTLTF